MVVTVVVCLLLSWRLVDSLPSVSWLVSVREGEEVPQEVVLSAWEDVPVPRIRGPGTRAPCVGTPTPCECLSLPRIREAGEVKGPEDSEG